MICGPSEISYWLQLKKTFNNNNIIFPILVPRNSVLWINHIISNKLNKLNLNIDSLFLEENILIKRWLKIQSNIDNLILDNKNHILNLYEIIKEVLLSVDNSFNSVIEKEKLKVVK